MYQMFWCIFQVSYIMCRFINNNLLLKTYKWLKIICPAFTSKQNGVPTCIVYLVCRELGLCLFALNIECDNGIWFNINIITFTYFIKVTKNLFVTSSLQNLVQLQQNLVTNTIYFKNVFVSPKSEFININSWKIPLNINE